MELGHYILIGIGLVILYIIVWNLGFVFNRNEDESLGKLLLKGLGVAVFWPVSGVGMLSGMGAIGMALNDKLAVTPFAFWFLGALISAGVFFWLSVRVLGGLGNYTR